MFWKKSLGCLCAAALIVSFVSARADAPQPAGSLASLARLAVSGESGGAGGAVAALRAAGYAGLDALLGAEGPTTPGVCWTPGLDDRSKRWCAAVDAVAGQRDASASRLYWHTDLEKAKAEALATGKPILSLRLLGRLDEEFSCANSRFFRAALYANQEIAAILRARFVLHWKSVRPVPRITIDFGDGRTLDRTITGNSAHYILSAEGRPLDVLPGLYGPGAFRRWLEEGDALARMPELAGPKGGKVLALVHERALRALLARFSSERLVAGLAQPASAPVRRLPGAPVPAAVAMPLAMTKSLSVEARVLQLLTPLEGDLEALARSADWERLAVLHAADAHLDEASRSLLGRENETGLRAEDALRNFEASMALDEVRNEYLLHSRIHRWYMRGEGTAEIEALNEKVYSELFLTPSSDPWLGLLPPDRYSGLSAGAVHASAEPSR